MAPSQGKFLDVLWDSVSPECICKSAFVCYRNIKIMIDFEPKNIIHLLASSSI